MSLRSKFIIILVILPFTCLAVFLYFSVESFIEDKKVFIFEANEMNAKKISANVLLLFERISNHTVPLIFSAETTPDFESIEIKESAIDREKVTHWLKTYAAAICSTKNNLSTFSDSPTYYYVYCKYNRDKVNIYGFKQELLSGLLANFNFTESLLASIDGTISVGTKKFPLGKNIFSLLNVSSKDQSLESQELGRFEVTNSSAKTPVLVTYFRIGKEPLYVFSMTPRTAASTAAWLFVYKGVLIGVILLIVALMASYGISAYLVRSIVKLRDAMVDFGNGKMDVELETNSNDEFSQLVNMFSKMVIQVRDLLSIRVDKARLETEMAVASRVQRSFLPKDRFESLPFEFAGYYLPANQCGGDWWTYFETDDFFVVCIGDATGHGMHSALMTAAAMAVISQFKKKFTTPDQLMEALNIAIYETSAGAIHMTCLVAAFDKKGQRVLYCNASHEMPLYFPASAGVTKDRIKVLGQINGPRLGESKLSQYTVTEENYDSNSIFLFYTDGLADLLNKENVPFAERNILKVIKSIRNSKVNAKGLSEDLEKALQDWHFDVPLKDDVSYCFLKVS